MTNVNKLCFFFLLKNLKVKLKHEEITAMETMEKIMTNPGLYLIRDKISGYLSHEDLESCCEVNPNWNRSLKRQSLIKYLLEFGNKHVESSKRVEEWKKVHEVIPGWSKAVKKIGIKMSTDDLKEIKDSLSFLTKQVDQDGNLSFLDCPKLFSFLGGFMW